MNPFEDPAGGFNPPNSQNPWSAFENSWLFHQYDNFANGGALYQLLAPGEAQYSEWSQQMTATMYQNWYNSAPEAMKRAIEAGINPFVAASGIVGAQNQVASAPPASPPSRLPEALSSAASLVGGLGNAFGQVAQGYATLSKLRHEIGKIDAETQNLFQSMGFTELQSKALSVQLKFLDQKEQIGVWQALANFDKTKAEYNNLLAQHNNIIAQFDEILAHKDLLVQQQGEVTARAALEEAQTKKENEISRWQKAENDFFIAHGYRPGTPIYESLRDMMVSNGTFDMMSFGNTISDYDAKVAGAVESAKLEAQSNYIYNIEYARQNGKNVADLMNGHVGSLADFANRLVNHSANLINGLGSKASDLFKSGKAKDIRRELTMILDTAYDQLEKYPEDSKRLNSLISEIQSALYLSNSELVEWWKKSNQ